MSTQGSERPARKTMSIPAPPAALAKVIRAASDPNGSLQDLGRVCAQDAGLTVELLRIAAGRDELAVLVDQEDDPSVGLPHEPITDRGDAPVVFLVDDELGDHLDRGRIRGAIEGRE